MHPDVIPARVLAYLTETDPEWVHVIYDGWLVYRDLDHEGRETQRLVCRISTLRDFQGARTAVFQKVER